MNEEENVFFDNLERYSRGVLSGDEVLKLEAGMKTDPDFRKKVEDHLLLLQTMRQAAERERVKARLEDYHSDFERFTTPSDDGIRTRKKWKAYLPTIAVAASVAVISVVGTYVATQSVKEKHTAEYRELRRNVEQIKKSQKELMEDIAEVKEKEEISSETYAGTGFLLSRSGYLITSSHVIRDADSVYVENKRFGRLKAQIVQNDPQNDIAVLLIMTSIEISGLPYTFSRTEADLGEDVFTLGFPREEIVYGEGTVSASSGYRQNLSSYQIAVPVNPGNSGGPLLDRAGNIIGMISGIQTETLGAAFAIKSPVILKSIDTVPADSLGKSLSLSMQNRLKGLSRVQQIKKIRDFIFVVKVYNRN
jgi:serine protease Do